MLFRSSNNSIHEQAIIKQLNFNKNHIIQKLVATKKELKQWQGKYTTALLTGANRKIAVTTLKNKIAALEERMVSLQKSNVRIKNQIFQHTQHKKVLQEVLKVQNKHIQIVSQKIIAGMYAWIKNRQDLHTGLVLSYEGDRDLKNVAFTYDQSLAAIVFVMLGDYQRARRILDFYLKQLDTGHPIYNAYYTSGGVYEYTIHSGVNAWVGLASLN